MRVLFVSGTDTGVGKTFVASLCLAHLLRSGKRVRALKPFCSGDRSDAILLWELQECRLPLDLINPFYFQQPLAPWTAARLAGKTVRLDEMLHLVQAHAPHTD